MKKIRTDIMGMPIIIETTDDASSETLDKAFAYFVYIDEKFSPYKNTSELNDINNGKISIDDTSADMKEVLELSEKTKNETNGFFDIKKPDGKYDTSGLVKGWAIYNASQILKKEGLKNFYIDVAGDVEVAGLYKGETPWKVGIRNPFSQNISEIVKVVSLSNAGIATSGNYVRGSHIYNPKIKESVQSEIVSLTVIGPNVYEADRFATAGFAMGEPGIQFIESLPGFEAYMINKDGIATMTTGFNKYVT